VSSNFVIQRDGSYLRVILPAAELDWVGVWRAVRLQVEDGIGFAEIIARCDSDEKTLEEVRDLVRRLDALGVDSIVEWDGASRMLMAVAS
jgi:hypothetical protein